MVRTQATMFLSAYVGLSCLTLYALKKPNPIFVDLLSAKLHDFLLGGIGPELELVLETVQLLLQVILLSLLGNKLVLQVQVVSEEHELEDVLR
jgi:hypothetical protein